MVKGKEPEDKIDMLNSCLTKKPFEKSNGFLLGKYGLLRLYKGRKVKVSSKGKIYEKRRVVRNIKEGCQGLLLSIFSASELIRFLMSSRSPSFNRLYCLASCRASSLIVRLRIVSSNMGSVP